MKKIYAEGPEIIVHVWDEADVITASFGDDNVGYWDGSWFGNKNGGTNGGDING